MILRFEVRLSAPEQADEFIATGDIRAGSYWVDIRAEQLSSLTRQIICHSPAFCDWLVSPVLDEECIILVRDKALTVDSIKADVLAGQYSILIGGREVSNE